MEKYDVESLEELVIFINNAVEKSKAKPETNQELQEFLDNYSATNLAQVAQTWENTEQEYLKKIEKLKEGREVPDDYEDLERERDELAREKITLEQEALVLNNSLKNKNKEVQNKDKALDQLKKEKSQSEISLNAKLTTEKQQHKGSLERIKLLTEQITTLNQEIGELKKKVEEREEASKMVDIWVEPIEIKVEEREETKGIMTQIFHDLTITVSQRGANRDEGPHIIGDAWKVSSEMMNTYSEDKDNNPGSLTGKKVQTVIIPNAGISKKNWAGDKFAKSDRNAKQMIKITGPFEKYDENTLTLTFKSENVKLEGILMAHSL